MNITNKKLSVIIPTMWKFPAFVDFLINLVDIDSIGEIIIINNDYKNTIRHWILDHAKIKFYNFTDNIFVNPAWNLGVSQSKFENVCLMNDDLLFDTSIFEFANNFLSDTNLLVVSPNKTGTATGEIVSKHYNNNDDLYRFGALMFIKKSNWIPIPSPLKLFFGDNWVFDTMHHRYHNNFVVKDLFYYTPWSVTVNTLFSDGGSEICNKEMALYPDLINGFINGLHSIPEIPKNKQFDVLEYLENEYLSSCNLTSDINENLPILRDLASTCTHVTEMGVRHGTSTRAFLATDCILRSYDIFTDATVTELFNKAKTIGKNVEYIIADTLITNIEETDLLFIDTWHTYDQLSAELKLHGNKAKQFLAFHDTHTFGVSGEQAGTVGLLPAILEFMTENQHWVVHSHTTVNNGLTVLRRNNS